MLQLGLGELRVLIHRLLSLSNVSKAGLERFLLANVSECHVYSFAVLPGAFIRHIGGGDYKNWAVERALWGALSPGWQRLIERIRRGVNALVLGLNALAELSG